MTHRFLEEHLVMVPMEPRRPGCSVVEGKDTTPAKVKALADATDACWSAIFAHDLQAFASAYKASFNAQIAMFPAMVNPVAYGKPCPEEAWNRIYRNIAQCLVCWHGRCRELVAGVIWRWLLKTLRLLQVSMRRR